MGQYRKEYHHRHYSRNHGFGWKAGRGGEECSEESVDAAKDFLGIHSPSKLMRDVIGKNMIAGFESGIVAETPNLEKTSAGSAQRAVESMQGIALQRSGTVVAGNQVPPAPTPGGGQGSTVVVLEKGSITGDVTMDGEKVGTLVALQWIPRLNERGRRVNDDLSRCADGRYKNLYRLGAEIGIDKYFLPRS